MRPLSLREQVLASISVIGLGLILALAVLLQGVVAHWFDTYERDSAEQGVQRAAAAVRAEQQSLGVILADWAAFDDTYDFMLSRSPAYLTANVQPESLQSAQIDFLAFVDRRGQVLTSRWLPAGQAAPQPLPDALGRALRQGVLNAPQSDLRAAYGTVMTLPGGLLLLESRPVVRSRHTGPARGSLVMGHLLDLGGLARTLGARQVRVEPRCPAAPCPAGAFNLRVLGKDRLSASLPLGGPGGLGVTVVTDRALHARGQAVVRTLLAAVCGAALLFILAVVLLLERQVLTRLAAYRGFVQRIADGQDLGTRRLPAGGGTELDALGQAVNGMLERLADGQREQAARQDVLHAIAATRPPEEVGEVLRAAVQSRWPDVQLHVSVRLPGARPWSLTGDAQPVGAVRGIVYSAPVYSPSGEVFGSLNAAWSNAALGVPPIVLAAHGERSLRGLKDLLSDLAELLGVAVEQGRLREQLSFQAHHDALTGLPNRRGLVPLLEEALARAARASAQVSLIYVDLDRFKRLNDTLGHAKGDTLLTVAAERLKAQVKSHDHVARIGGDEFVVVLTRPEGPSVAQRVASALLEALQEPFDLGDSHFITTASIGISHYPSDALDAENLLRQADLAMYDAKQQGKNRAALYSPATNAAAVERLSLETDLRAAMQSGALQLAYQPQYDLASGRMVGAEALMRWRHPERGEVSPAQFIPVAEDSGLIVPLGTWALQESCRTAQEWWSQGHQIRVAVNVSAPQFARADFPDLVARTLRESSLPPRALTLEITETLLMEDAETTKLRLQQLARIGVQVALDDFGTGYSSLGYLHRLPIHALKIDRSFIRDMMQNRDADQIVQTVVDLAQRLNLRAIAEGVETAGQAERLAELGGVIVQGFWYARPLPEYAMLAALGRNAAPAIQTAATNALN